MREGCEKESEEMLRQQLQCYKFSLKKDHKKNIKDQREEQ